MSKGVILLSAGGTGGHLFPAEALAHELRSRGWSVHLATDKRADRFAGDFPAEEIHIVESATMGSRNPVAVLKTFLSLWRGYKQAAAVLQKLKPAAVIGFGGYPTLPPVFAATRRGTPTLIHEQNAVMGRANKALAARVSVIAGGFLPDEGPFADKIITTGNPVRPEVIAAAGKDYVPVQKGGRFNLLVFGGSQGAQFFSQVIPEAISLLPEADRKRMNIVQQARPEDEAEVRVIYQKLGIAADVSPFFNDLAQRISNAHLVISRSGASTVSELSVIGRPSVLVPYPYALDHDQAANAAALAATGGAEVRKQGDLSPEAIMGLISWFLNDPRHCVTMAAAAKSTGKPDAARLLANLAEAIAAGIPVSQYRQGERR